MLLIFFKLKLFATYPRHISSALGIFYS